MDFEDVDYWDELKEVMNWSRNRYIAPCISAGLLWRLIISTIYPNILLMKKSSVSSSIGLM